MCMCNFLGLDTPTVSASSHSKNTPLTFVSITLHSFECKVTEKEHII